MTAATQIRPVGPWTWLLVNRHRWWVKQIPNFVTSLRIGVPFCALASYHAYRHGAIGQASLWAILLGVLAAGDIVDGYLARMIHESPVGRLFDPLLDKVMSFAVLSCMWLSLSHSQVRGQALATTGVCIILILSLELGLALLAVVGVFARRKGERVIPGANEWGKLKFRWSCIGMATSYALLYWGGPIRLWATPLLLSACLMMSAYYAYLSIRGHLQAHR
jgi:phosphatidylglycerophosphate synthase